MRRKNRESRLNTSASMVSTRFVVRFEGSSSRTSFSLSTRAVADKQNMHTRREQACKAGISIQFAPEVESAAVFQEYRG